jgi:hypothetical protein
VNANGAWGWAAGQPRSEFVDQPRTQFVSGVREQFVSTQPLSVLERPLSADEIKRVDSLLAQVQRGSEAFKITEAIMGERGVPLTLHLTVEDLTDPDLDAYVLQFGSASDRAALGLLKEVLERERLLAQTIAAEFAQFRPHVITALEASAGSNGVGSAFESYRFIRALLNRYGWLDTPRIFNDVLGPDEGARFLGMNIQGGLHRLAVAALGDLSQKPADVSIPVARVLGLQPRRISGSKPEKYSNHAFGLAIDIDATWNPHFKGEAAKIVTRHSGVDFTQPFVKPGIAIDAAYEKLSQASQRFTDWLHAALNREAKVHGDLETAKAKRADAKTPDEQKAADAEVQKAQEALARDFNELIELDTLREEFGAKTVAEWEIHGILTIPIALVRQLKDRGFGWGAEWQTHKDVMHFELDPDKLLTGQRSPVGRDKLLE